MPGLKQALRFVVTLLGGIGQRRGRVPVHHHLAGDHARAAALGLGEECFDRGRMGRAVDSCRGGAVAQKLVQKEAGDAGGVRRIGELLLFDEGVPVQPLEELRAVGRDHLGLRIVDVGIYQAGQDHAVRIVIDGSAGRHFHQQLRGVPDPSDAPVLDDQQTVGMMLIA